MARLYTLVPLPSGSFASLDLAARAVFGEIYDRLRLSSYNQIGGSMDWYDEAEQAVFCLYAQAELAKAVGISERTVRRCLEDLRRAGIVRWKKVAYMGTCRYFIDDSIMRELRRQ